MRTTCRFGRTASDSSVLTAARTAGAAAIRKEGITAPGILGIRYD